MVQSPRWKDCILRSHEAVGIAANQGVLPNHGDTDVQHGVNFRKDQARRPNRLVEGATCVLLHSTNSRLEERRLDGKKIVCLVLDEAHKAKGNYDYVKMIPLLEEAGERMRIVGLSATPGMHIIYPGGY